MRFTASTIGTANRAYVTSASGVSVIDTTNNTIIATADIGFVPWGVAANAATNRVYVLNNDGVYPTEPAMSVIDTTSNTIMANPYLGTLETMAAPRNIAIHPSANRAYVSTDSNMIHIIATSSNGNADTGGFSVGTRFTAGLAVNPATNRLYVAEGSPFGGTAAGTIFVYDTTSIETSTAYLATVTVGLDPEDVALNAAANRAYVTNCGSGTISVINTASNTVVATVAVGTSPFAVAVNASANRAYVTNKGSGTVSVIDTTSNTVVATVTVGTSPFAVAVNTSANRAYVTNAGSGTVSVIDTTSNTVVATVTVGANPHGVAVIP